MSKSFPNLQKCATSEYLSTDMRLLSRRQCVNIVHIWYTYHISEGWRWIGGGSGEKSYQARGCTKVCEATVSSHYLVKFTAHRILSSHCKVRAAPVTAQISMEIYVNLTFQHTGMLIDIFVLVTKRDNKTRTLRGTYTPIVFDL